LAGVLSGVLAGVLAGVLRAVVCCARAAAPLGLGEAAVAVAVGVCACACAEGVVRPLVAGPAVLREWCWSAGSVADWEGALLLAWSPICGWCICVRAWEACAMTASSSA
jgi:hypothetical protein